MAGRNYYLLSALPPIGHFGDPPPLSLSDFASMLRQADGPAEIVEALLLGDDLTQRQAVLSGEIDPEAADPSVLAPEQVRDEAPLPEYLAAERAGEGGSRVAADVIWEPYYRHAAEVARRRGSDLLADWVRLDVGLRNALAEERAKALGLAPHAYRVAADLAEGTSKHAEAVSEWSAASDPLAAQRALDQYRWRWLAEREPYFSFEDDELTVYAARLMLLHRWNRIQQTDGEPPEGAVPEVPPLDEGASSRPAAAAT